MVNSTRIDEQDRTIENLTRTVEEMRIEAQANREGKF